jgi:preprotein translocase subunit SecG
MSQANNDNSVVLLQGASAVGAFLTALTPIVSIVFMLVSIVSGCILIYKFFTKQK